MMMMMKNALAVLLIGAALAGAAQARGADPIYVPPRMALLDEQGQALGVDRVRAAILRGSGTRSWQVVSQEPGKVRLRFDKGGGKHEVVVDANYDAGGFQLVYVSSINMKYESTAGGAEIHPNYNKWVRNLGQDIQAAARAAR